MSVGQPPARHLVIQTEDLAPEAAAWLGERCELVRCATDDPQAEDLLRNASALVVRTYTRVDAALLQRCPKLKVVGRAGVGLDNIDLDACRAHGMRVVHTPGANTQAVVEFVTAMLCDGLRPRCFLDAPMQSLDDWQSLRKELVADRQIGDLTLGVVGLGRIGSRVAQVAEALGMRVIYCDIKHKGDIPQRLGLQQLCAEADVVTVHVDGRPDNRRVIGADAFGRMKSDVVFINTSRGMVVDETACAEFMINHPAACAMLDVTEPEPFTETSPLLDIDNVHISPHIAGATASAKLAMSWVVRDVWRVLQGEEPEHPAF
ncbi:MAG: NAD(P)-dependent oxidoreductase [Planctomycetota bacterium]